MTDAIDRCVLIRAEFERRKWLGLPAPSLAEIDALLGRVTARGAKP